MKLSIVIVSYNVKHFLFQCLQSVIAASGNLESEIFVVDNASNDGTVDLVAKHFPTVKIIANKENLGFSKANNLAISQSTGAFILLLNPDTLVQEDTFEKTVNFMERTPKMGAVGVKMIDGSGNFLPESKRGIPTPVAALAKMTGLNKLFPKSRLFGQYHLGFLSENENHPINVLCGAFMCIPKKVLDEVGLLDEDFFMYGEDIDLSYRIEKAGYQNYYLSETTIIHYKGESTKKLTLNYVKIFYSAMLIFAEKHQTGGTKWFFSFLIKMAIYFRASLAMVINFFTLHKNKFLEAVIIFFCLFFLTKYWENHIKYIDSYPVEMFTLHLPYYTVIWVLSLIASGSYQKYHSYQRLVKSIIVGLLFILIIYGLLPAELRFSRGIILFGALSITAALFLFRFIIGRGSRRQQEGLLGNILVVGNNQTFEFVKGIMQSLAPKTPLIGYISKEHHLDNMHQIGSFDDLEFLIAKFKAEEVVFDLNHLSFKSAIDFIVKHKNRILCYTLPPKADFIIASQSKNTNGVFISKLNSFQIERATSKKDKRRNDLMLCGISLIFFPLLIFSSRGRKILSNVYVVLISEKTWVGYFSILGEQLPILSIPVIDIAHNDFHQKRFYAEYYQAALDRKYFFRYMFYWDK